MLNILRMVRLGADAARRAAPSVQDWKRARNFNEDEAWRNLASKNWLEAEKFFNLALAEPRQSESKQLELLLGLAEAHSKQAHFPRAEEIAQKAVDLATRTKNHPQHLAAMDILVNLELEQGRPAAAAPHAEEIVQLERSRSKPDQQRLVLQLRRLGEVYLAMANLIRAEAVYEESVRLSEQCFGSEHGETADCLTGLGSVLRQVGRHEDAQLFLRGALDIHRRVRGHDSPDVTRDLDHLAGSLEDSGKIEAAAAEYEKALALRERQIGGDPAETAWFKVRLGSLYLQTGRSSASRELLTHAIRVLEKTGNDRYLTALEVMAQAEEHAGRGKEAVRLRYRAEQVRATRVTPQAPLKTYELADNLSVVMPAPMTTTMTTPPSLWREPSAIPAPKQEAPVPAPASLELWKPQAPERDLGDLQQLFRTLEHLQTDGPAQPPPPASAPEQPAAGPDFAAFYRQQPGAQGGAPFAPPPIPWRPAAQYSSHAAAPADGLERLSQQLSQGGAGAPVESHAVEFPNVSPEPVASNPVSAQRDLPQPGSTQPYVAVSNSATEAYIITPLSIPAGQTETERTATILAALSQQVQTKPGQITEVQTPQVATQSVVEHLVEHPVATHAVQPDERVLPSAPAPAPSPELVALHEAYDGLLNLLSPEHDLLDTGISSPAHAAAGHTTEQVGDPAISQAAESEPKPIQRSVPIGIPAAANFSRIDVASLPAFSSAPHEPRQTLPGLPSSGRVVQPALQPSLDMPLSGQRKPEPAGIERDSPVASLPAELAPFLQASSAAFALADALSTQASTEPESAGPESPEQRSSGQASIQEAAGPDFTQPVFGSALPIAGLDKPAKLEPSSLLASDVRLSWSAPSAQEAIAGFHAATESARTRTVQQDGETVAPAAAGGIAIPLHEGTDSAHAAVAVEPAFAFSLNSPLRPVRADVIDSEDLESKLRATELLESLAQAGRVVLPLAAPEKPLDASCAATLQPDLTWAAVSLPPVRPAGGIAAEPPPRTPFEAPATQVPVPVQLARPWKDRRRPRVAPQFPEDRSVLPASVLASVFTNGPAETFNPSGALAMAAPQLKSAAAQTPREFALNPEFTEAPLVILDHHTPIPEANLGSARIASIELTHSDPPADAFAAFVSNFPNEFAFSGSAAKFPGTAAESETPFSAVFAPSATSVPAGGLVHDNGNVQFGPQGGGPYEVRATEVRAWVARYRDTRVLYPRPNQHQLSHDDRMPEEPSPTVTQAQKTEPMAALEIAVEPEPSRPPVAARSERTSDSDAGLPTFGGFGDPNADEDLPFF